MNPKDKKIFITGIAGFIGFHLAKRLLSEGFDVIGIDNFNDYYDVSLKQNRIIKLKQISSINKTFLDLIIGDICDQEKIELIFRKNRPSIVIHLAAQAGVRYSIRNPKKYIESNLLGFSNILENCRNFKINNFIYASSSSVYGGNQKIPFSENDSVDHPISLYASTKRSNELLAHSYSHLYGLPSIGLRFFTVYGPWGRPDMAPMIFTDAIYREKPIRIFNKGNMTRDFTYIDDIVENIFRLLHKPASSDSNFNKSCPTPESSWAPFRIFNIGNGRSINLMDFIEILEQEIGKKSIKIFEEIKEGDVKDTASENERIKTWTGYSPKTKLEEGIKKFIIWYKEYYKVN